MKLGKEEIQKIFLSFLLLVGLLYCYFNMLLGPLSDEQTKAQNAIADLTPKINDANAIIKDVKVREKTAPEVSAVLDEIKAGIPDGAPIAWFPPAIIGFFKRQGIDKCNIHVISSGPVNNLPGFTKFSWNLSLPRVEVAPLATTLAALENEQPLLEITELHINASKDDVQYQTATLTLTTIVKQ